MTTFDNYPNFLLALCLWREARNQPIAAQTGIKHTILNRAANPKGPYRHCPDVITNILCPAQFSSFNKGSSQAVLIPDPDHSIDYKAFEQCCDVADTQDQDPTNGATHYYDISIQAPAWATPETFTCQIGRIRFHKLY